jgi:hypothetical protein
LRRDRRHLRRRRRNLRGFSAARFPEFAQLGADDLGLDQNVRMLADHDEVFDVVTANKDELALAIEVEGVDDAQAGLTCASSRHPQFTAEGQTEHKQDEQRRNQEGNGRGCKHQCFVFKQSIHKGRHRATHPTR